MTTEDMHQQALFQWADAATVGDVHVGSYLLAIPNGGKRSIKTAVDLKKTGVKKGVPDMFLPVPRGTMHGLWIELKAPSGANLRKGRLSQEQVDWLDKLGNQGYAAVVCWGWESARNTIKEYLECAA